MNTRPRIFEGCHTATRETIGFWKERASRKIRSSRVTGTLCSSSPRWLESAERESRKKYFRRGCIVCASGHEHRFSREWHPRVCAHGRSDRLSEAFYSSAAPFVANQSRKWRGMSGPFTKYIILRWPKWPRASNPIAFGLPSLSHERSCPILILRTIGTFNRRW